eukprot:snap_masked-scaffold_17-processed-gene-4.4-mRNA-1 protein AED:1.00 eAED:1.00 QI:0/-1/0/0/-1/1/1/0/73
MKIILLIINQNADSFFDNQNQNDYQMIIDNFYQIIPLVAGLEQVVDEISEDSPENIYIKCSKKHHASISMITV